MAQFSKISEERLLTCHPDIVAVCRELIKQYDFSVLCGYRDQKEQDKAFNEGNSKVIYPNSKHNTKPSLAVDLAPYNKTEPHIDWGNVSAFKEMWIRFDTIAKVLKNEGKISSIFVWGGSWTTLKDYPHIEIKER